MPKNPIDRHVGGRVRLRRMIIGISQERLGDALGVTFQQVQKYEKGTNLMGASRLQQTAKALGVPVEFFFDGAPHVSSDAVRASDVAPSFVADFLTTSEGVQLMRAFVRITDASIRRRLISLVRAMEATNDKPRPGLVSAQAIFIALSRAGQARPQPFSAINAFRTVAMSKSIE